MSGKSIVISLVTYIVNIFFRFSDFMNIGILQHTHLTLKPVAVVVNGLLFKSSVLQCSSYV